jgi:tRNA (guanine-N7-)-methyltransferase
VADPSEPAVGTERNCAPRSFVRRGGRLTHSQRRALNDYWEHFGLSNDGLLEPGEVFSRAGPLCLEIGFGMGDTLAALAQANPDWNYIGIEVHEPGIGRLLNLAVEQNLINLRVMRADAAIVLRDCFPPASLDQVLIYFPDPWPKKRHHKRRLVQPQLVSRIVRCLKPAGQLLLATDWEEYADHMLQVLDATSELRNVAGAGCFSERPPTRFTTKFERRGQRLGHSVWDLIYSRRTVTAATEVSNNDEV